MTVPPLMTLFLGSASRRQRAMLCLHVPSTRLRAIRLRLSVRITTRRDGRSTGQDDIRTTSSADAFVTVTKLLVPGTARCAAPRQLCQVSPAGGEHGGGAAEAAGAAMAPTAATEMRTTHERRMRRSSPIAYFRCNCPLVQARPLTP